MQYDIKQIYNIKFMTTKLNDSFFFFISEKIMKQQNVTVQVDNIDYTCRYIVNKQLTYYYYY